MIVLHAPAAMKTITTMNSPHHGDREMIIFTEEKVLGAVVAVVLTGAASMLLWMAAPPSLKGFACTDDPSIALAARVAGDSWQFDEFQAYSESGLKVWYRNEDYGLGISSHSDGMALPDQGGAFRQNAGR